MIMKSHGIPKSKAVERVVLEAAIETLQGENKKLREQINSQSNEVRISRECAESIFKALTEIQDGCQCFNTRSEFKVYQELSQAIKKASK
jgi:hypothetical protein